MEFLELAWTDDGEGNFTLALTWPRQASEYDRAEVGGILHRHGFLSLGLDRWTAPADLDAPLAVTDAIARFGIATETAIDVLPPILEIALAPRPLI